jgi:hypothetical protein
VRGVGCGNAQTAGGRACQVAVRGRCENLSMLAELEGLHRAIEPIEVGDEPPDEITVKPQVQAGWGGVRSEGWSLRLDRIERRAENDSRAIYRPV